MRNRAGIQCALSHGSKYRNLESHGPWDSNPWDAWDLNKYRWDIPETKNLWDNRIPSFGTTWDSRPMGPLRFSRDMFPMAYGILSPKDNFLQAVSISVV